VAIPDPRWLEILKASGWQMAAVGAACGLFLLVAHWGWLPPLDPWMIQLAAIAALICSFLAFASVVSATLRLFPIQTWVVHLINRHRAKRAVRNYIPQMTDHEKQATCSQKIRRCSLLRVTADMQLPCYRAGSLSLQHVPANMFRCQMCRWQSQIMFGMCSLSRINSPTNPRPRAVGMM
jgi:hypothetical protein